MRDLSRAGKSIYNFTDYRTFLNQSAKDKASARNRAVSIKRWAQKLGYRSQRSVGMVFDGTRLPSAGMIHRMARELDLSDSEHRYFALLVEKERQSRRGSDYSATQKELESLRPVGRDTSEIEPGLFQYIGHWYHLVLKQLVESPRFISDPAFAFARLKGKVPRLVIREALERMVRLGIIDRAAAPRGYKPRKKNLRTMNDVPSEAVKEHHRQMLKRAAEALVEEPVSRRENLTLTLRFDPKRIVEVKNYLREFREQFDTQFESAESNEVFQLLVHFFPHTVPGEDT